MSASSAAYSAAFSTDTWSKVICLAPLPATSSKWIVSRPRYFRATESMSCRVAVLSST